MVQQLPDEDRLNVTREWALNRIAVAMGGRLAEEIIFNQITTGAGNDLEQATSTARKMVCEWGMSDMGPLAFGRNEEHPFVGREVSQPRVYSEQTAQKIDSEIHRIVMEQYELAKTVLEDNLDLLKVTAEALLEHEVLDGGELSLLIEEGPQALRAELARKVEESARRPTAPKSSYRSKSRRATDHAPIELKPKASKS